MSRIISRFDTNFDMFLETGSPGVFGRLEGIKDLLEILCDDYPNNKEFKEALDHVILRAQTDLNLSVYPILRKEST